MKDQHNENSHPVDQYFVQQSELLEIQYNPKHWQQLSEQLAGQPIPGSASDSAEEDIPKAAYFPKRSWLLLGLFFLLSSTAILWQLYSARSMEEIQQYQESGISSDNASGSTTGLIRQETYESIEESEDEYSNPQGTTGMNEDMARQRNSQVVQPLETYSLPMEIKSISAQTRPLVVPLDDKTGTKKEVFIFW